jgi:hypothetical protein
MKNKKIVKGISASGAKAVAFPGYTRVKLALWVGAFEALNPGGSGCF